MQDYGQSDLFSGIKDASLARLLISELEEGFEVKIVRFRHLSDLCAALGEGGTMMTGGELAHVAWCEARASYVHGNFLATVLLCQSLAEHMLASYISLGLNAEIIPARITYRETLRLCLSKQVISEHNAEELRMLAELRNPLSHFRGIDDPSNLTRRAIDSGLAAGMHLRSDAAFAISVAVKLLALPAFRLSGERLE